jgi:signal transduction histidine kinase
MLTPDKDRAQELPLARFLERARSYCFHELRGSLGTISNYASVLELGQANSTEISDLARRIRTSALRTARLLQLFGNAVDLASRPLNSRTTDLRELAHAVLVEVGGAGDVSCEDPEASAEVDPDLVNFAWRAYVEMETGCRGQPIHHVVLRVSSGTGKSEFELECCDGTPPADSGEEGLESYLGRISGSARLEHAPGLTLAHHLVTSHEGRMDLSGEPGRASRLRLALPVIASATCTAL